MSWLIGGARVASFCDMDERSLIGFDLRGRVGWHTGAQACSGEIIDGISQTPLHKTPCLISWTYVVRRSVGKSKKAHPVMSVPSHGDQGKEDTSATATTLQEY